jgi:prepilin-type processing-associated H-X9-DG protein
MPLRLKTTDSSFLECLAEHRMLTVSQIAAVCRKTRQVARRRLRDLEQAGFVEAVGTEYGRGRGRPEITMGLTEQGASVLKEKGLIGEEIPLDKIRGDCIFCADHQLLLNWFRIHLKQIKPLRPNLLIRVLAHNSPFLPRDKNDVGVTTNYSPVPGSGTKGVKFTPDADPWPYADCLASFHETNDPGRLFGKSNVVYVDGHLDMVAPVNSFNATWVEKGSWLSNKQ